MAQATFRKVLIANRGEIAVRIARACRELGIGTVGVASEADRNALHARSVDHCVVIGPAPSTESYLVQERIIAVAQEQGCDAIHPGYGFLSQSADFADAVEAAGLRFVGPSGAAMRIMGDKTAARAAMIAAKVPVVPGYQGTGDESDEKLMAEATRIGFPLLVKAAAGGGGKGMRVLNGPEGLAENVAMARREAEKSFGDGRVFLERFVRDAHHVEIQVLADSHGNTVHLFERECSVQRRYQKIIEESPAPILAHLSDGDALRARICATAVAAAEASGYVNAGTVEFLVEPETESFFFLEMNTRLQVEHPVTECVTGIDIVQAQLRVAMGEPLWFTQNDLKQRPHTIECRLYAEDAAAHFAPSSGTAHHVSFPTGPGLRVDAGIASGDAVTLYYDPMLAKIIATAESREAALVRMRAALESVQILGVTTNRELLLAVLEHPEFVAGRVSTTFVEKTLADWQPEEPTPAQRREALVLLAVSEYLEESASVASADGPQDADTFNPWRRRDGFRVGSV